MPPPQASIQITELPRASTTLYTSLPRSTYDYPNACSPKSLLKIHVNISVNAKRPVRYMIPLGLPWWVMRRICCLYISGNFSVHILGHFHLGTQVILKVNLPESKSSRLASSYWQHCPSNADWSTQCGARNIYAILLLTLRSNFPRAVLLQCWIQLPLRQ